MGQSFLDNISYILANPACSTTRLDAQLHLLHSNLDNFKTDPRSPKYKSEWETSFSAEKKTDQIAKDLELYSELRTSMEKLVPSTVSYEEFWKRYYFLRSELDAEEQKRKELLKGMDRSFVQVIHQSIANTLNSCCERRRRSRMGRGQRRGRRGR